MSVLGMLTLCACGDVPVQEGLSQTEALATRQRLATAGLSATVSAQAQGYAVRLPAAQAAKAVTILAATPLRQPCSAEGASGSLLPSPQQEARRANAQRECILASDLELLPHVVEARVRLSAGPGGLDTASPQRASALLRTDGPTNAHEVALHLSQAVPGLTPGAVNVSVQPAPSRPEPVATSPQLDRLGPLNIARASRPLAEIILATLLLSNLVTASLLLLVWHRTRRR